MQPTDQMMADAMATVPEADRNPMVETNIRILLTNALRYYELGFKCNEDEALVRDEDPERLSANQIRWLQQVVHRAEQAFAVVEGRRTAVQMAEQYRKELELLRDAWRRGDLTPKVFETALGRVRDDPKRA